MLRKKIIYILLIILSVCFTIFVHPLFALPSLLLMHLFINETDILYRENPSYIEPDLSKLFDENAGPIEICQKREKAIIFVHGFPSCPYTYKYASEISDKAGYDAYAPLLPGFGTDMDDFLSTNFSQWFAYLEDYYLEKRKIYKNLYVVGLSLGGAMTLKLSEKYSGTHNAPDAVSVTAAPVLLNSLRERTIKSWLLYSIRTISWFIQSIESKSERWKDMEDNHSEWIGYHGVFPRQAYSIKMALEKIRSDLGKITVPIIAFHVPGDRTVNYKNLTYIEERISSDKKQFHTLEYKGFYNTGHCLFLYESIRVKLINDIINYFDKDEIRC